MSGIDNIEIKKLMSENECMDLKAVTTSSYTKKKLSLLLDLDSTLICSISLKNELHLLPEQFQKKFNYADMDNYYRVFERPFLQSFLDYIFSKYNISIFTAADKDYASFVVQKFITKGRLDRRIQFFFSGYHNEISEKLYNAPKDLRMIWKDFALADFDKNNTILLDDLPEVFKANPDNVVRAFPFELLTKDNEPNLAAQHDNFLLMAISLIEEKEKNLKLKTDNTTWLE